jgi:acyl carrier protein
MRDPQGIRERICAFIAEPAPENTAAIKDDENLFESGIMDSFRIVALAMFFEDEFGVSIDFEELSESDFANLTALTNLVMSHSA